jgi:hypothetical protein
VVEHSPEIGAWFAAYDSPQQDLVMAVREVILGSDERVTETIKREALQDLVRIRVDLKA